MSDSLLVLMMLNFLISLITYIVILSDNDNNFIKWVKRSFSERNWFGKLQISLVIIWMSPIIVIYSIIYPIGWIIAKIILGIIFVYEKIVELGKL